jgi:hypothetical protein
MIKDTAWIIVGYITVVLNFICSVCLIIYSLWWVVGNTDTCRSRCHKDTVRYATQDEHSAGTSRRESGSLLVTDRGDGMDTGTDSQHVKNDDAIRWFFVGPVTAMMIGVSVCTVSISHFILIVDIQRQTRSTCTSTEMVSLGGTLLALCLSQFRPLSIVADQIIGSGRHSICGHVTVGHIVTALFYISTVTSIMILGWVSSARTHQEATSAFVTVGPSCGWYSDSSVEGTIALDIYFAAIGTMLCAALFLANRVWVDDVPVYAQDHPHLMRSWDYFDEHRSILGIFVWSNVVYMIGIAIASVVIGTTWIGSREDDPTHLDGYGAPHGVAPLVLTAILIMSTGLFMEIPTASVRYIHNSRKNMHSREVRLDDGATSERMYTRYARPLTQQSGQHPRVVCSLDRPPDHDDDYGVQNQLTPKPQDVVTKNITFDHNRNHGR